jgi:hypothetical protein
MKLHNPLSVAWVMLQSVSISNAQTLEHGKLSSKLVTGAWQRVERVGDGRQTGLDLTIRLIFQEDGKCANVATKAAVKGMRVPPEFANQPEGVMSYGRWKLTDNMIVMAWEFQTKPRQGTPEHISNTIVELSKDSLTWQPAPNPGRHSSPARTWERIDFPVAKLIAAADRRIAFWKETRDYHEKGLDSRAVLGFERKRDVVVVDGDDFTHLSHLPNANRSEKTLGAIKAWSSELKWLDAFLAK